ncbi:MAG TPA: hypothetical protein PK611_01730, partial [Saprospiraceae bacterium]|nr:hypothetical protein [Saprospiraceae bacterium]
MESFQTNGKAKSKLDYLMDTKKWWQPLTFILIISLLGVGMIGVQTYVDAPPLTTFSSKDGKVIFDKKTIERGQEVFHKYALMQYGSFFGDGAERGPDFTAEALHLQSKYMTEYYKNQFESTHNRKVESYEMIQFEDRVKKELKHNGYDEAKDIIFVNDAQEYAFEHTKNYYIDKFTTPAAVRGGTIENYITDKNELKDLSAFFYWGAWVCTTVRPGTDFSYTHNWPYDPGSGNTPTSPVILWSVLGLLAFVLMCGIVLYYIGHYNQIAGKFFKPATRDLFNEERVSKFRPVAIQKATYKFFFVAILLFFLQVSSGLITINDFVNWLGYLGITLADGLPVTISRSWHLMLSLYWISTCWIASSIFILPILSKKEMPELVKWVNTLFVLLVILVGGSLAGMVMGPLG